MPRRIVDLSVRLTNNMPAHKFFPRPVIVPHLTWDDMLKLGNGVPGDPNGWSRTTYISMVDHAGTHVDAFILPIAAASQSTRCRSTCSWVRRSASI